MHQQLVVVYLSERDQIVLVRQRKRVREKKSYQSTSEIFHPGVIRVIRLKFNYLMVNSRLLKDRMEFCQTNHFMVNLKTGPPSNTSATKII
jgi:hypothetical protein